MHTYLTRALTPAAASLAVALSAQSHTVAPTAYATNDAISFNWVAGASQAVRQQTLVGASHLTSMVGQNIHAIELRRSAKNATFAGGSSNLSVQLSISPNAPLDCSSIYAHNVGPAPLQVFNGTITFPTSPPTTGTTVDWTANNIVRIAFSTPFYYAGGTLCIDINGAPIAGLEANWWMADAEFEDLPGTVTNLGGGCGNYGGPNSEWASVQRRSLVAGGTAQMFAYGTPNGLGVAAIGQKSTVGTPLSLLGFNSPVGCELFLSTLDVLEARIFVPDTEAPSRGGRADVELKIPGISAVLGLSLATQWLDWSQSATSNAIEWTIAPAVPSLDMALVDGDPQEANGNVTVHLAHVIRFEYQ